MRDGLAFCNARWCWWCSMSFLSSVRLSSDGGLRLWVEDSTLHLPKGSQQLAPLCQRSLMMDECVMGWRFVMLRPLGWCFNVDFTSVSSDARLSYALNHSGWLRHTVCQSIVWAENLLHHTNFRDFGVSSPKNPGKSKTECLWLDIYQHYNANIKIPVLSFNVPWSGDSKSVTII